jgi:metal-responsive CopG/Arc/MetJ family transcriptional regulator
MSINVEINKNLISELDRLSKSLKVDRSKIITAALKRYVHLEEMKLIRNELKGVGKKNGYANENEVLSGIS